MQGTVNSISISPITKSQNCGVVVYEVKVNFVNPPPPEVKLGMSSTVDIITSQTSNVLLVPNRAIQEDNQGNPTVDVLVNNKIEARPMQLGISDGINTEVISGLKKGDMVIDNPDTKFRDISDNKIRQLIDETIIELSEITKDLSHGQS